MEEGAQFTGLERKSQLNTACNQQREVIFCMQTCKISSSNSAAAGKEGMQIQLYR
jgi:hypothetical protein